MTDPARPASGPPEAPALPDGAARGLRVAGAATGLVGVALAATTTVWPTKILALRVPEVGDFTRGSEQWLWSWGRDVVHYVSNGLVLADDPGPQPVARLVLLVAVLVLAAAGLGAWLVSPGRGGRLSAAAGTALALGTVTSSVVARVSFDDRTIGLQPGLVSVTTTAGWLEVVSVGLLLVALGAVLVPVLLPGPTAALVRRVHGRVSRTGGADGAGGASRTAGPEVPGAARPAPSPTLTPTLRDVERPVGTHPPPVGFSDDGGDGTGRPAG